MITIKPAGAELWRRFFFTSRDGSGRNFGQTACFHITDSGYHKLFRGPAIAAVSSAIDAVITTAEDHGFRVGDDVYHYGLPTELGGLNGAQVVSEVLSSTTYKVGFDSSTFSAVTDVGIVGKDIGTRVSVEDYGIVVAALVKDGHPEWWQLPLDY